MTTQTNPRLTSSLLKRSALAIALLALGTFSTIPAEASCSTIPGCTKGSTAANKFASTTVEAAVDTFEMLVEEYMTEIKDAFTRLANQNSNNIQNYTKSASGLQDGQLTHMTSIDMGQQRTAAALEMIPSLTACRTESNASRLANSQFSVSKINDYNASQLSATNYAANGAGSGSERGSIQASQTTFNDFTNGFCDPAVINPPGGVPCTLVNDSAGKPMAFRFTQPYQAVFGVPNGTIPPSATNPENRAARLFVRMAVEPVPTDPLRGPLLTRQEGQNAFIERQSDMATISLARGALDHMVDDRIGTMTAGGESLEYLRQRAFSDASGIAKDVIDRAGQPTSANMDDLAPLVGDINKIYLQIFNNLERLAAIKATHLARVVGEQPAGNASMASRPVNN